MFYDIEKSPSISNMLLNSLTFLPALAEDLKKDSKTVVEKFERLRESLLKPERMRVAVAGDVMSMKHPRLTWEQSFMKFEVCSSANVPFRSAGSDDETKPTEENTLATFNRS